MEEVNKNRRVDNTDKKLHISDVRSNYSIGDKYELFYNSNNINNKKFEIRGIIDDSVIVTLSSKGNYKMENIEWLDYNIERGNLKKIE
jgi:hypothetical protein